MELEELIFSRRSVRNFIDKPIEKEKLKALGKAAIWAPTGGNSQPWKFVIISNPDTIHLIKTLSPGLLGEPAALIAVLSRRKYNIDKMGPIGETLALMDCSMASQNILLRAWDLGLGSCAVRSFNQKAVGEIIQSPEDCTPELLITLGYPGKSPSPPPRDTGAVVWETCGEGV